MEGQDQSGFKEMARLILKATPPEHRKRVLRALNEAKDPANIAANEAAEAETERRVQYRSCLRNAIQRSGLSGDMLKDTLDAYKPEHRLQFQAKRLAEQFVENWPNVEGRGIIYHGPKGAGKSHLVRAIGLAILTGNPNTDVRYYYAPQIERTLRAEGLDRSHYEGTCHIVPDTEAALTGCDLLLLDDISKLDPGVNSGWMLNMIGCLIDVAERTGKPIICGTSNDTPPEIAAVLGEPFVSRLHGLAVWREIQGRDLRYDAKEPDWAKSEIHHPAGSADLPVEDL